MEVHTMESLLKTQFKLVILDEKEYSILWRLQLEAKSKITMMNQVEEENF
jgi:hypothetical protein